MGAGGPRPGRPTVRRSSRPVALLVASLALLAACTGPARTEVRGSDDEVEVFTWWASGSEKPALDALVSVFTEQNPQTAFVDGAIAGGAGSAAKDLLASRLENNDPPDTFQVHAGAELREHVAAGHLQALDGLAAELALTEVLPQSVLELLVVDGTLYAVPSNIHRANVLWSNASVLQDAGLDPALTYTSLDEWFVALDAVEDSGRTPLALASTWTQVHLLEQVLLSRLGPAAYTGLWDGSTDPGVPEVTAALGDFERLLGYADDDRDRLDWEDATQRVVAGEAAFTVMGDWALATFQSGGLPADDVLWAPFPGTAGTFNLLIDAFTLPVDAPHPESAQRWLSTVASAQGQADLSAAKGSIPARSDVDAAGLGRYQESAATAFRSDTLVASLTHGTAGGTDLLADVTAAVGRFSAGESDLAELRTDLERALG